MNLSLWNEVLKFCKLEWLGLNKPTLWLFFFTGSEEIDNEYTVDAALYNPFLDSDQELNDLESDDEVDGQISESEADRVRITYTEHFDGSIGQTNEDICEELYENELENGLSVLPESQQGEEEFKESYRVTFAEPTEVLLSN